MTTSSQAGRDTASVGSPTYVPQYDVCNEIARDTGLEPLLVECVLQHLRHDDSVLSDRRLEPVQHEGQWIGRQWVMSEAGAVLWRSAAAEVAEVLHRTRTEGQQ